MALNDIKISLLDRLKSLVGLPVIYYPNVGASTPTDEHIVPHVLPSDTMPVGLRTTDKESGIFQVSIFVEKGSGEILALDYAKTILEGFPRNLQLDNVCIDRSGSIGPSFYDANWQITPVSIRYRNFS
jgi:hypothetical protein